MIQVNDPWLAIDFDFACAVRGNKADEEELRKAPRSQPPPNSEEEFWYTVNKVRGMKGLPPVKRPANSKGR